MSVRRSCRGQVVRGFLAGLLVLAATIPVARSRGQQPTPAMELGYATPIQFTETLSASPVQMNTVDVATAELVERLRQAEMRLAMLEQQQPAQALPTGADPPDPAAGAPKSLLDEVKDAAAEEETKKEEKPAEKKWYEKYTFRGYAQFRWNETLDEDDDSAPAQHVGDRSVGDNQNFLIRRARLIWAADLSEHLYVYLQPDFAVTPPGSTDATYFAQIRDWYGDIYCDECKVNRFRVGQSKVPYGWENLQSSSNRLPLDRADPLNSAVRNERDLGVFYYWTPEWAQEFFTHINDEGLKGSGNYGVFGIGAYNGQGGSLLEQNDNLHSVIRLTLPLKFDNGQLMEVGAQAYTGKYTVLSTPISPLGVGGPARPTGTLETGNQQGHREERVAGTLVLYPQPWGFLTEWNVGRGPSLNDDQDAVGERSLYGGYAMLYYRYQSRCYGEWWPFVRWSYYKGGYKPERNAPFSEIDELELGVEWQMNKQVELTTMFTTTDRTNTVARNEANVLSYEQFRGELLRIQLQINY